jgi:D-glycero-alpha-D-manno-heptose-7-phosphate kinase
VILTRTPLRLSLGGGGTDLPHYAEEHGGFVVSATIDRYVDVALSPGRIDQPVRFSHDRTVTAARVSDLDHAITREALVMLDHPADATVVSMGRVPAGTGLGSSGAYSVGLLHALHAWRCESRSGDQLAAEAWHLECERLCRPVGKHDHYMAALGGVQRLRIDREARVRASQVPLGDDFTAELARVLVLAYTGRCRDSGPILARQDRPAGRVGAGHYLHDIKRIGQAVAAELAAERLTELGPLFDQHWSVKRTASGVTDPALDDLYATARRNGARGGKLLGAGGGGFFLFVVDPDATGRLRTVLRERGLTPMPFRFTSAGSRVLLNEPEGD